jgi:glutathione S-transferase
MKLYAHVNRKSPNSFKLQVALAEAGAACEYLPVDLGKGEQKRPEFLRLNPHGKIPVLVDGDFVLPESDAILWYIAESFPGAELLPPPGDAGPAARRQRARVLEWCDFASTALYPGYSDAYRHTQFLPPEERNAALGEAALARLDRALGVMEAVLGGEAARPCLAGSYSIADIAAASVMQAMRLRLPPALTDHPAINAWMDRVAARPAWSRTLAAIAT